MIAMKERFVRDGWEEEDVVPLEFADPGGSSLGHAHELALAIQTLLAKTGAEEVDVVAHSMGGLAVWALLQEKGSHPPINRVVFLATPFQGTVTAYLAWGEGGPEMIPGSEFLRGLQKGGWPQNWVNALAIRTPLDLTVVPGYGATLLGAGDEVICCPTHQGLLDHEETYLAIRDFLLYGKRGEREAAGSWPDQRADVAKSMR
jgi:triacylglycerol lipase